jgi:hypothetical protein
LPDNRQTAGISRPDLTLCMISPPTLAGVLTSGFWVVVCLGWT